MELSSVEFHQELYIPAIHKNLFHLPHIQVIGTHPCGKTRLEALNCCSYFQDMLCHCDYDKHVEARFAHQIQSEYYDGNRYVYIEFI